jgi:hypothetical protein
MFGALLLESFLQALLFQRELLTLLAQLLPAQFELAVCPFLESPHSRSLAAEPILIGDQVGFTSLQAGFLSLPVSAIALDQLAAQLAHSCAILSDLLAFLLQFGAQTGQLLALLLERIASRGTLRLELRSFLSELLLQLLEPLLPFIQPGGKLGFLSLQGRSTLHQSRFFFRQGRLLRRHGGHLDPDRIALAIQQDGIGAGSLGRGRGAEDNGELGGAKADHIAAGQPMCLNPRAIDESTRGTVEIAEEWAGLVEDNGAVKGGDPGVWKPNITARSLTDEGQGVIEEEPGATEGSRLHHQFARRIVLSRQGR